ncbi:MAG: DNA recombination protein RmuC [Gammaproteobacteria bacterium]|nr:DNA recombination protein RmuC [Gammaproteobacteria bacterium]
MNIDANLIIPIIVALVIGLLIGFLLAYLITMHYKSALATEQRIHAEKLKLIDQANERLSDSFSALSSRALQQNNETFLRLAEQNLNKHQIQASNELEKREKSIETLVKPIRETLEKTERQLHNMEKERKESFGSLSEHLRQMSDGQLRLQRETNNLVSALRRPEVRGQWGEMTLKRLAELAGMTEYCDFYEQESVSGEAGLLRPDMIVRMPDRRELVVDAKTPLDAYLNAVQADNDQQREIELQRHARKLRDRVKELASKAYWLQFKNSPDYVILFVPGDQFLSAALEQDASILEYALSNKVILATPTSLIALLRAVAFGWRQQAVARNAEQIQQLGEELHSRMLAFTEHLTKLGSSLGNSVDHFNKAIGSLERSVLPGARKFSELGIESRKQIESMDPIEKAPRKPNS